MKTAAELFISEEQREALIEILELFESGKVEKFDDFLISENYPKYGFNMSKWKEQGDCGTVCCIGGWAEELGEVSMDYDALGRSNHGPRGAMAKLFYVDKDDGEDASQGQMIKITVEQAAKALRNFLTDGLPHWQEIL